ncbi:MAG TPA: hypothetical protein VJH68_01275 [Candidatus Nanoarchaeia archaeon]|nr:hypothetical protein [Candidatus Nanoarchaeia archaeon]
MTEKTFSPNDPMIKRRIRARATDSVTEKIQAIRKIAGYVSKISSLYHDQYAAAHLVRRYVTGFPERSYTLESLESIGDRVKIFYIEQKALYDRRERHGVAHAINLLEELFEDQGERESGSNCVAKSSRKPSLVDYDESHEHYGK